jgi:hypothetical protein
MRRIVCLAASLMLVGGAARADEQADARGIIDKAIKAAGGEENLAKYKAETFKGKGKYYGMGAGMDYTGDWAVQHPDKIRMQIEVAVGDMNFTFVRVVNGDKVWRKTGDNTEEVDDKDQINEAKEAGYVGSVTDLVPLKDKGFQFAALGESEVDGAKAVGIKVSHKGHRDVELYFDKAKGLLVKSATTVKDDMTGQEARQEVFVSNYKEVSGVQRPMKIVINRDGKSFVDVEVTEMQLHEKLDDAVFGKP